MLVGRAIETLVDNLLMQYVEDFEEEFSYSGETGISVFDSLTLPQRLGLLHEVARHLLTPTESALPLSASTEAAVAAIFSELRDQVAIEIELGDDTGNLPASSSCDRDSELGEDATWRELVLAAHRSLFGRTGDSNEDSEFNEGEILRPAADCRDLEAWEDLIEHLTDAILWDRDFEMSDAFLDSDPKVSQQRRRLLGINDDYFTHVAPDPLPDEVRRLVTFTQEIVRRKPR